MQTRRGLFGWILTFFSGLFAKKTALSEEAPQTSRAQVLHYDNGIRLLNWIGVGWWLPKTAFGRLCSITCPLPALGETTGQLRLWFDYSKEHGGMGQFPDLSPSGFTLVQDQSGDHGNMLVFEYQYDHGIDFARNAIRVTILMLSLLKYDFKSRFNNPHCSFSREHGKRWVDLYEVNECSYGATDPQISKYLTQCVDEEVSKISMLG